MVNLLVVPKSLFLMRFMARSYRQYSDIPRDFLNQSHPLLGWEEEEEENQKEYKQLLVL